MPQHKRDAADRIAAGDYYRPSRHGLPADAEPAVAPEKLKRPASLRGRAAAVWKELVALLTGVVRRRDVPVLAELCRWIERSERIAEALDSLDPTAKEFKGLLVAAGIATDKVALLSTRFGISPADRAKIRAVPSDATPKKPRVATRPRTSLDGSAFV